MPSCRLLPTAPVFSFTLATFAADNAMDIILQETGKVFAAVLEDAGVYKNT